jgi:hypothetical protein
MSKPRQLRYAEIMTKPTSGGVDHDTAHRKLCDDKTFSESFGFIGSGYMKKDKYT